MSGMSSTKPTSLSGIVKSADEHGLPDSTGLNKLGLGAGWFRSGNKALHRAIQESVHENQVGLGGKNSLGAAPGALSLAEAANRLVGGGMKILEKFAKEENRRINLGDLRKLNNVMMETHADVHLPLDPKERVEIQNRIKKMFPRGVSDLITASAALGRNWDVEISKADGDQAGMIEVAFTDKSDPEAQFEFFLDQANKRILWGDTLAKRAPRGDPLFQQVAELLTTLVRRSVGGASSDNALQKAVLSVDRDFDQRRLDSLPIKDVFKRPGELESKRPGGFEVVLQDDAREEVDRRLAEMFEGGRLGLARTAAANLDGSWALRTSKVGGVDLHKDAYRGKVQDQGKVQVVFTDRSNKGTQFEFILDQANKRILCGGNFAKWAEKGDPRAKQMSELLLALAQSSLDIPSNGNAADVKALDRVEFKPGDVDTYALLKNEYGISCERGRYPLTMQMAGLFQKYRVDFEQIINGNKTEEVGKGLEKVKEISEEIDKIVINKVGSCSIEDRSFVRSANNTAGVSESRNNAEDMLVSVSNTEPGDVLKIADIKEKLSLKNLRSVPELKSAADSLSKHYRTNVPLGRVLLELMSQKPDEETRNWVLVDLAPKTNLQLAPDAGQRVAGAGAGRPRIGKVTFLGDKKELLPEDQIEIAKIHSSFNEMFEHNGIYAFRKLASKALGEDWNADMSMADGDHAGMVKVAFTGTNGEGPLEFFLDDTGRRIVCGDEIAARAAKGDPGLDQVTTLLTALVQSHALDRAVFKVPSDVDPHSLLSNGFGASSELPEDGYFDLVYGPTSEVPDRDAARQQVNG